MMRGRTSSCYCCSTLIRARRLRIAHDSTRSLTTSAVVGENGATPQSAKLPTRDWSQLKSPNPPAPTRGNQYPPAESSFSNARPGGFGGNNRSPPRIGRDAGGFGIGRPNRSEPSNASGFGRAGPSRPSPRDVPSDFGPPSARVSGWGQNRPNLRDRTQELPGLSKWAGSAPAGPSSSAAPGHFPGRQAPHLNPSPPNQFARSEPPARFGPPRPGRPGLGGPQRPRRELDSVDGPPPASGFGVIKPGQPGIAETERRGKFAAIGNRPGRQLGRPEARPEAATGPASRGTFEPETDESERMAAELDVGDESEEAAARRKRGGAAGGSRSFRERFQMGQAGEEDDFVIERGGRRSDGSVKRSRDSGPTGEEIEAERRRKAEIKAAKMKRAQLQAERKVFIPSTVTVARLATILGQKWSRLQIRMVQLGMNEEQRRSDYSEYSSSTTVIHLLSLLYSAWHRRSRQHRH